ncbi:MAG: aldehyde dehydrogenase family protein [Promethearchaeota archaeon]
MAASKTISYNPATGEELGCYPNHSVEDIPQIIQSARKGFEKWRNIPIQERARILAYLVPLLDHNYDKIAKLISQEMGKPPFEAGAHEVLPAMDAVSYFVLEGPPALEPVKIDIGFFDLLHKRGYVRWDPLGVVAIISPWNYPFAIPFVEVVMALLAGNAVVLKAASVTTGVAMEIKKLIEELHQHGLPPEAFQLVIGSGGTVGKEIIRQKVDLICFTGSKEVGREILHLAAEHQTPVILETSGKSPMIVLEDADLERATNAALWGCFMNAGQVCASIKRIYVIESIADEFKEKLLLKAKKLRIGRTSQKNDIDIGSMVNSEEAKKIDAIVQIAREEGNRILIGGKYADVTPSNPKVFYEPTIVDQVSNQSTVVRTEIFGPVLTIIEVPNAEEAVKQANDSDFGLSAAIFTKNKNRAEKLAENLQYGTVMINNVGPIGHAMPAAPWGGFKQSGMGRTHSIWGLKAMSAMKHINVDDSEEDTDFFWFPYSSEQGDIIEYLRSFIQDKIEHLLKKET